MKLVNGLIGVIAVVALLVGGLAYMQSQQQPAPQAGALTVSPQGLC